MTKFFIAFILCFTATVMQIQANQRTTNFTN